jgi:hypothetical protein
VVQRIIRSRKLETMKIICCYSGEPHPKAVEAIEKFAPETEFIETKGLYGYGEVITAHWTGEEDLVNIEGDKEITAEVIPSFRDCDEPWCTFGAKTLPPPYRKLVYHGLSCAKFSARLQQIVKPEEFICEDVPWQPCRHCRNKGCWNQLDVRMVRAFEAHGVDFPHTHGVLKHHHVYDLDWWQEWKKDWDFLQDTEARLREIHARAWPAFPGVDEINKEMMS